MALTFKMTSIGPENYIAPCQKKKRFAHVPSRLSVILQLCACLFSVALPSIAQNSTGLAPSATAVNPYPDTKEGLRQLLLDFISDAKSNNSARLNNEIKSTEIPDYANWLPKIWSGPGPSWVEPYGNNLRKNEVQFHKLLNYLARQDGGLVVRKVNDEPQSGKGMEWGLLQSMTQPVDIYYASWKREPGPVNDQRDIAVGYFYFVDGSFRWNSLVHLAGTRLVHRVDPVYPYPSDGQHPSGTVFLQFVIARDGSVKAKTIRTMPVAQASKDAKLIKAASDALQQWQYLPLDLYNDSDKVVSSARIVVAPLAPVNP